jgi:hypothetical protein
MRYGNSLLRTDGSKGPAAAQRLEQAIALARRPAAARRFAERVQRLAFH